MTKKNLLLLVFIILCNVPAANLSAITLPDSLLSIKKAYEYCFQSTDTAMSILNSLRDRGLEPAWKVSMTAGDIYRRQCHYHAAIDCYEAALKEEAVKEDLNLQSEIWRGLMNCHDMLMDDILLTDDLYQLNKLAGECGNETHKALVHFVSGKRFHLHGQKEWGYKNCLESLEVLKSSDYWNKAWSLRTCYSVLVKLYRTDGQYDKAMEMSLLQEQMVRKPCPDDIPGERVRDLRNVYAQRASLLAEAGRQLEADAAYKQWCETKSGNPYDDREILSYLLMSNRLEEGLRVVERYKKFLIDEGDSINIRMLDALTYESHTFSLQNDYKRAVMNYGPMASIAYRLHQLTSKKEMQARYQSLQDKDRLHKRNIWLLVVIVLLFGLLFVLGLYLWYRHVLSEKNMTIRRAVNQISAYQKAAIIADESVDEQEQVSAAAHQDTPAAPVERAPEPPLQEHKVVTKKVETEDEDEILFVKLDKLITRNQLFLNPDLSRDDLMRLIGVDKNRIGRIMSRYSDASNVSTYINQKRAYFAANYIKQHPGYTIDAVVNACGMSNTSTLNRAFKALYGMTPSEYRQQVVSGRTGG